MAFRNIRAARTLFGAGLALTLASGLAFAQNDPAGPPADAPPAVGDTISQNLADAGPPPPEAAPPGQWRQNAGPGHFRGGWGPGGRPAGPGPNFGLFAPSPNKNLSSGDVKTIATAILLEHGNHDWSVSDIVTQPDKSIRFSFTTPHGDVIAVFALNPATGLITRLS